MTIKTVIENKIKAVFNQYALSAVIYAEEYIGSGKGKAKKEIAINYLINLLPSYLKPFAALFKKAITAIADVLIEIAVEKLHKIQEIGSVEKWMLTK